MCGACNRSRKAEPYANLPLHSHGDRSTSRTGYRNKFSLVHFPQPQRRAAQPCTWCRTAPQKGTRYGGVWELANLKDPGSNSATLPAPPCPALPVFFCCGGSERRKSLLIFGRLSTALDTLNPTPQTQAFGPRHSSSRSFP